MTLAHVAEGLHLIGVKYLLYTSQVKAKEREQQVLTFETSETYRVFLMELKHGSRGLWVIYTLIITQPDSYDAATL